MIQFKNFTRRALLPMGLILAATMISCSDDENTSTGVTEADAADAIEASVSASSSGMAKMATDASTLAEDEDVYTYAPQLECGQQYTVSYNPTYTGTNYSYDYSGTRNYLISCTGAGVPETFTYSASLEGTYETPRMLSDDNSTSSLTVTGLAPSSSTATINGTYVRNGYQESKVRLMRHFNSVITIDLNNITLNKDTQTISGGTASVSITGNGSLGGSFSYNGTITFNGNGTATLVINGTTYTISVN
ncbi:hypothetical protein ACLI1A_03610 [Flavobacterium sp. RHBU_3]|uniref:hypothetical protein n=1 Tax=Flavobacterium sp. RHBU_3 TaxID=3391184 RepID=UPI003984F3A4